MNLLRIQKTTGIKPNWSTFYQRQFHRKTETQKRKKIEFSLKSKKKNNSEYPKEQPSHESEEKTSGCSGGYL